MVQMKEAPQKRPTLENPDFISHMVQMKAFSNASSRFEATTLYIPHGSDERQKIDRKEMKQLLFISHMVQMKGFFKKQFQMLI